MFMSYRGAIWIRMNPDRDSEADSVEECLPKVPERHNSDTHTQSKLVLDPNTVHPSLESDWYADKNK